LNNGILCCSAARTIADVMLQLQYAIQSNVNAIIIFHNHPSGNVQPSESDIAIIRKIKESCIVMDIQVLDHLIIVPEGNYYSMGDEEIV
jgi:DNA repair protein RadC